MTEQSEVDMLEAARLTRAGRLGEATALLQARLGGAFRGEAPPDGARPWRLPEAVRGLVGRLRPLVRDPAERPPAPSPDLMPEGGQFLARSYSNQVGLREYRLYVPSRYRGQAVPLIVMLHGCKQSPEDFAAGTRMNVHAESRTFLVAYPAQPAAANSSRCWNWFDPHHQRRGAGEASLIAGITGQVMRDYSVDPRRVYVAGLSAGAAQAAIMASAYPDLYAAVGVHSGLACGAAHDLPSAFAAMRQGRAEATDNRAGAAVVDAPHAVVPAIVFHGDHDSIVHPRNVEQILAQSAAGTPLERAVEHGQVPGGHGYTRTLYTAASGRVMLEAWTVHGAGHAWSGGSPKGSYTDPQGPDAAREIVRFFLEHPRAASA